MNATSLSNKTSPMTSTAIRAPRGQFASQVMRHAVWVFLILETVVFSASSPHFLSVANLSNILLQGSFVGFIAIGLTLVLINGTIDLTVGSVIGLCGCLAAGLQWLGLIPALVLTLGAGAGLGLLNGLIIERTGVNSFVVTLAGMIGIRGLVFLYAGNDALVARYDVFSEIGTMMVGPVALVSIVFLVLLVALQWVLAKTVHGREAYAIGGNRSAAINAGVRVSRHIVVNFVISGLLAAICGIAMASQLGGATPTLGEGYEMWAVIAVVVGGTRFQGGSGDLWGTLGGVLAFSVLRNGMDLLHVQPFYVSLIIGSSLIVVLLLDRKVSRA
ncbi:ABC transporter permease [Paraburkholderia sp. J12]|uniref:ABC transporter permease n=1 Tax=Paraburkholderia sp. J12 TaxID=2805432 RepID=UPI002ABE0431|nr:ABC transporter permease [Paraburkholderia sp. J12]